MRIKLEGVADEQTSAGLSNLVEEWNTRILILYVEEIK